MTKTGLFIIIVIFFMVGCSDHNSNKECVIPPDQMVDILVDIHVADGTMAIKKFNVKKHVYQIEGYYQHIYDKHGYSRVLIDSAIGYYTQHPHEYDKIYDEVLEKLSKIESSLDIDEKE